MNVWVRRSPLFILMKYLFDIVEESDIPLLEKQALHDALKDTLIVKYTATFVDHEENKLTARGLLAVSEHFDIIQQVECALLRRHTLPQDGKKLIKLQVRDKIPYENRTG